MSFSFDSSLDDDVSVVRQRVGQTTAPSLVADETIEAYIALGKTPVQAAAQVARDLSAYWASMASEVTVDRQTVNTASRAKTYADLARSLDAEALAAAPASAPGPYPGVIVTGLNDLPFGASADMDFIPCGWPDGRYEW